MPGHHGQAPTLDPEMNAVARAPRMFSHTTVPRRRPRRRLRRTIRGARPLALSVATALALALRNAAPAAAQTHEWLPDAQRFAPLLADPHEIRLAAGLAWTNLFDPSRQSRERPPFAFAFADPDDMRRDLQAMVSLGGTLPLWGTPGHEDKGVLLAVQAGVSARFRIEEPSRDYAASDWIVAFPFEWRDGPLATRVRLLHRSSHLGDEFIYATGAQRIEYGHEAVDVVVAYRVHPSTRIYGGSAWVFRSNTESEPFFHLSAVDIQDGAALQAGFDGEWALRDSGRLSAIAGLDWQAAQRTEWKSQLSAAIGLAARGAGGGLRIMLRYYNGTSTLGEFFLTDESYWAIEAVAIP